MQKPEWLKNKYDSKSVEKINQLLGQLSIHTVCKEADCPNIGECYKKNTATFMIMGNICTRNCRFCSVQKGTASPLDLAEPDNIALAAQKLNLKHIVITSVTRDDLEDGGAMHFSKTICSLKKVLPESTIEVLIPDLGGEKQNLEIIMAAQPDVINHNIETVPSLYPEVRPEADYHRSLNILKYIKEKEPSMITKTGIMIGLGESKKEVIKVIEDLAQIGCDILTIGQYLCPSVNHIPVKRYLSPQMFAQYKKIAAQKGIRYVASDPLVRSSYNALEAIRVIKGRGCYDLCR
ncbi:MAG: lipoyl synthase [Bacillota bacterium]